MTPGALQGVRVLDLSRYIPGPYATMTLADLGADVIKVEPREGDPMRAFPPRVGDESAAHAALNRGKRSLAVDLRAEEGAALLRRLAGTTPHHGQHERSWRALAAGAAAALDRPTPP